MIQKSAVFTVRDSPAGSLLARCLSEQMAGGFAFSGQHQRTSRIGPPKQALRLSTLISLMGSCAKDCSALSGDP